MEDMCQITERQTEYKYHSSYERIAKAIMQHSSVPRMDVTNFFEMVLFSWLTGNNDMHLKNFSLYEPQENTWRLTPAYDMLNAVIVNPKDDEELALTFNGRKKRLTCDDFIKAGATMGIEQKTVERLIAKYKRLRPAMEDAINHSFLNDNLKQRYCDVFRKRTEAI